MTLDEAKARLYSEIENACESGPGTNPAGLRQAIMDYIDARLEKIESRLHSIDGKET